MIGNILVFLVILISSILIVRAFYFENRNEVFDLTKPTVFETGLLVFQSQKNHCAVFFSFKISSWKFEKPLAQKTFTILFKILPFSAILALEWTSKKNCYANFYIKLEKSSFLTQARELVDNLDNSFKIMLGAANVRILTSEALLKHFGLGIPGIVRLIKKNGKFAIKIQTDITTEKRSFAQIHPISRETVTKIFTKFPSNSTRIFLPIQRKENNLKIADSFVMVSGEELNKHSSQQLRNSSISLEILESSKILRIFGDILSRNMVQDKCEEYNFKNAANLVLDSIPVAENYELITELPPVRKQHIPQQDISPSTWREILVELSSKFELSYEINPIVYVDKFPTRFDAKINDLIFFILSDTQDQQVRWLVKKLTLPQKPKEIKRIVLLISGQIMKTLVKDAISLTQSPSRFKIISTYQELKKFLETYKNQTHNRGQALVQVT